MRTDPSSPHSPLQLPAALAADWARDGVALSRGAIEPATATRWEQETRDLPGGPRCVPRMPMVTWFEQGFLGDERSSPCDGLAVNAAFLAQVSAITGLGPFDQAQTQVWVNRYQPGEWVPPHQDRSGDCQLLICLEAPPEGAVGGVLHVEDQPVPLVAGDAVVFRASGLNHRMTPVEGDVRGPSGAARVVFVVRLSVAV